MSYARHCTTCGSVFDTPDVRRLYCPECRPVSRRSANPARTQKRRHNALRFVGVDGEGVDRPDGSHDYVMLSVGDRSLVNPDGSELSIGSILSFLWECHTGDPGATYVGFFLGYDFVQWFKHLPVRQAHLLLTNAGIAERTSQRRTGANPLPDPVVYLGWEIDVMAGRRFKLRPHRHQLSQFSDTCRNRTCGVRLETTQDASMGGHDEASSSQSVSGNWMYICDTGSFWQTSFLKVIDPKNWVGDPVASDDEFALVRRGKESRGMLIPYGDVSFVDEMLRYNVLENELLARVTTRLNEGFMNDAIPIRLRTHEWFGPGRAAQTWMDMLHKRVADPVVSVANKKSVAGDGSVVVRQNETGLLNADVYASAPDWFVNAAKDSYYGGWFEIPMHGHVGDVWEYDINSAYPYIISQLPCLHRTGRHTGVYHRGTDAHYPRGEGVFTLLYGVFRGSNPHLGALPFRTRTGNILRPHHVKGWYWAHEVEAAVSAGLVDTVDVENWVSFNACSCAAPFDHDEIGIRRMYNLRLQVGKNSPSGKAFKLVYNSSYGKTAQSVGSPKYANSIYASLITAGCRTLILQAIASHPMGPSGVAMVATDGVYFLGRHGVLPLSADRLGAWDETFREDMTLLMPGVYWDQKAREAVKRFEVPSMKSRGVSARDLSSEIQRLDEDFAEFHQHVSRGVRDTPWPAIEFNVRLQIVSAKLALHRGDWGSAGRVNHDVIRRISANPESKRVPTPIFDEDTGVIRTIPYPQWKSLESTPYTKSFGYTDPLRDVDLVVTPDGRDPLAEHRELLHEH